MQWKKWLFPIVALLAIAPAAQSQTLIGTYLRCSTANEGEADFIMNQVFAPVYDRHVQPGGLLGWGWVEHQAGGEWRRIVTMTADDTPTAWDQWGEIVGEIEDAHPEAWHRFNEICDSHDDYIWNLLSSSENEGAGSTPDQWLSTYWKCDEATETRADELMEQMTAVLDEQIAAGHIGGWGWYGHEVGGEYRRLLTVTAADGFDLLEGRALAVQALEAGHADVLAEFGSVCNGHVDYVWANGRSEE